MISIVVRQRRLWTWTLGLAATAILVTACVAIIHNQQTTRQLAREALLNELVQQFDELAAALLDRFDGLTDRAEIVALAAKLDRPTAGLLVIDRSGHPWFAPASLPQAQAMYAVQAEVVWSRNDLGVDHVHRLDNFATIAGVEQSPMMMVLRTRSAPGLAIGCVRSFAAVQARLSYLDRRSTWLMFGWMGGMLVVVTLVWWLVFKALRRALVQQVVTPLEDLTVSFAAIGGGGQGLRQVGAEDLLEVARLTIEFNQLAGQLALSRAAEDRLRSELEARVNQRTAELAASNRELEAFSYSVSHDLRAPLRAVDGFSHALAEDAAQRLNAEDRRLLERIRQAAARMGSLIDDLLELSRVSRVRAEPRLVDLSALANEVRQELADGDPQSQVTWLITQDLVAWADPGLLRIVLVNLLGNAWKYTGHTAQPRIELRAAAAASGMSAFAVIDNGAGFDQALAGKLFAPFQRLHRVDQFPGTGIGLATVARIVQRHGGTITVAAEVDRGAAFTVQLPFPVSATVRA